jgi:DNA-binding transcriptional ArsR family regulator
VVVLVAAHPTRVNLIGHPEIPLTVGRHCVIVNPMVNSQTLDRRLAALADPTRRAIVERLSRGEATVSELASPFDMSLPAVLKHLGVLEGAGLMRSRKVGRVKTCRLEPAALDPVAAWIGDRRAVWEQRLDALEQHLEEA